ncbi:hypothetical protein ColLi_03213 [Colletotrichum liriopes]|uniref:Uncharacterized protein n=1 Tax=Colletotrichum liriopes TaxID=708192 RepID=A0AA37GGA9_9PEZI|nr:hypothetical protein ColLi_03213 [Colletotrichum liriopes]
MTISREQAFGSPRRMQVEHGTCLSHLTFREAQALQLRGARWVVRKRDGVSDDMSPSRQSGCS